VTVDITDKKTSSHGIGQYGLGNRVLNDSSTMAKIPEVEPIMPWLKT